MKPAWDKLGDSYASSSTVLIGDVDCTVEKDLCQRFGVKGYPTIKTFSAGGDPEGDKYEGGRDFEALKKHAETLGPSCSYANIDLCDAEQTAFINEKAALPKAALDAEVAELEAKLKKANDDQQELLKSLQKQYEDGKKTTDDLVAEVSPNLRLMKGIKKDGHEEL